MSETIQSLETQIKALEAKRIIPDQENALLIYAQLLSDYTSITSLSDLTLPLDDGVCAKIYSDLDIDENRFCSHSKMYKQPWTSEESSQTVAWLKKYHKDFHIFFEASKIDRLYFPLDNHTDVRWDDLLFRVMVKRLQRLRCAAYLDMGEGRVTQALDKAACWLRIAYQLIQQPLDEQMSMGFNLITDGLKILGQYLINTSIEICDDMLDSLQTVCSQQIPQWESIAYEKKLVDTLTYKYFEEHPDYSWCAPIDCDWYYEKSLSLRRQYRFFIEFRRYRNRTGRWPTRLDQIESSLLEGSWDEFKGVHSFILWFSRKCFVMCRPADPTNKEQVEILVYKNHSLGPGEKVLIVKQIQACIELLKDRNLTSREVYHLLQDMDRLALPVLKRNRNHPNPRIREQVKYLLD